MVDNKTAHSAQNYDKQIEKTIPNYSFFHNETIDLVKTVQPAPTVWLDTGCGTGNLIEKAANIFPKTKFVAAEPAVNMLKIAKDKLKAAGIPAIECIEAGTQDINCAKESFDIITAIQAHHYLDYATRIKATLNCFRMLKSKGLYITFENIRNTTLTGNQIGLERWRQYQMRQGKDAEEADNHIARFDKAYFPITLTEHLEILHNAGFQTTEIFWVSNMQAGFYAIKHI